MCDGGSGGGNPRTNVSGVVMIGRGSDGATLIPSLLHERFLIRARRLQFVAVLRPPSGLLLLGEVEDLAVGLSQVLLLFEVDLERPLDCHKSDSTLQGENGNVRKTDIRKAEK